MKLLGRDQIIHFGTEGVAGHALDGEVLWLHPWRGPHPHVSVPVQISETRIFISSGYGTGCELFELVQKENGQMTTRSVWKNIRLKSKFGIVLAHEGYLYGLDDGILTCLDLKTGERMWKDGRYGHGQALLADGLILLLTEGGELVLVEPSPERLKEVERFPVFRSKTWNPPALAGDYLILRNDRESACFQLKRAGNQQKLSLFYLQKLFSATMMGAMLGPTQVIKNRALCSPAGEFQSFTKTCGRVQGPGGNQGFYDLN